MGQNFVWVGQALVWVGHGLPGLIPKTAFAGHPVSFCGHVNLPYHIVSYRINSPNLLRDKLPCHRH